MAVATVAVLALLAMVLVRAAAECDGQRPIMAASTASKKSYTEFYEEDPLYIEVSQGEDLTIFCSANDTNNLRILDGRHHLQARRLNSTTIHYAVKKPNFSEQIYNCTSGTGCENSIRVAICPAITINLPTVRRGQDPDEYFVVLGEQYEIICQGNENEPIIIESSTKDSFEIKALNTTTVKYKALADRADILTLSCSSYDNECSSDVTLILDHYPEAQNFQCILNDKKFECTWISSSKSNMFTVFHKDNSGDMSFFCTVYGSEATRKCTWDSFTWEYEELKSFYEYSFLIESCNQFVCENKTFFTNKESVRVLKSPVRLQVFNISSRGDVVISWFHRYNGCITECVYKMEYRLLAMTWRKADLSPVECDSNLIVGPGINCKVELSLPCPSSPYDIKVYVKRMERGRIKHSPWSDPASLHILTPPRTDDTLNAECRAELKEPDRINSADRALNKVAKLLSHVIENNAELTKKISDLEKKRARVKALRESAAART